MINPKLIYFLTVAAVALSFAAHAQFSTSEFGAGAFETGSANSFVHGLASYENVDSADLSATVSQLRADCSASVFPEAISFMDANADGVLECSEVNNALSWSYGTNFNGVSSEQAIFILEHLDACGVVDDACLAGAAQAAQNFVSTSISDAGSTALSNLAAIVAVADSATTVNVDNDLQLFDTNHDGSIEDEEIVALLAVDPQITATVIQPAGNPGLFASAYLQELAALGGDPSTSEINSAILSGNSWVVNPPQVTAPSSLTLDGGDNTPQTDPLIVYDGTCSARGGSGCSSEQDNVTFAVTVSKGPTSWSANDPDNPFTVDSDGHIVVNTSASGVDSIHDLDAGTYNISVTVTDNNENSYGLTDTLNNLTVTVTNEEGCVVNNGISASNFNAGSAANISGAAVTISGNHNSRDLLFVKGATSRSTANGKSYSNFGYPGITASYSTSSGVLRFYGTTSEANWVNIFKKVGFIYNSTGAVGQTNRSLVFSMSNKVPFLHPETGGWHFYEYIPDRRVHFHVVMDDVNDNSYSNPSDIHYLFGLKPYLATITSGAEQSYIQPKIQGQGWIGGCDHLHNSNVRGWCDVGDDEFDDNLNRTDGRPFSNSWKGESKWVWVTGPERGTPIGTDNNTGCRTGKNFTPHDGAYENFNRLEPNNCRNEHMLHVYGHGKWNDYKVTDRRIQGYIVEWGGARNDPIYGQVGGRALDLTEVKTYNVASEGQFCTHR